MQSQARVSVESTPHQEQAGPASVFDVSHAHPQVPITSALQRIAAETRTPPLQAMKEFARLAFGPGRLSFEDYVKYRLFDEAFLNGADKNAFVGQRRNRDLVVEINHRHDWYGLLANKVASASYLAAYGLPSIPMAAIFAPGSSAQMPSLLRSRDELRAFLLRPEAYPLFGKPVESFQSLGSLALSGCDPGARELVGTDGRRTSVETLLDDVEKHYSAGYVFQELLSSHRDLVPAIGPRLATVRIVTIATPTGPKVFRAGWKLPARGNDADNFWRVGNLLAGLDLDTGRVRQAASGTGFEMKDVAHHPDTGADLIGLPIPNWPDLKAVALEGARLLRHFAIIGWDMASTDRGPVIVEANETPDFTLVQMADRRGVLGEEFAELLARQKRDAAAHVKQIKADLAKL